MPKLPSASTLLSVLLMTIAHLAQADGPPAWLTGTTQKTWQVEAFDINLGSEATCTKGVQYTFSVEGRLNIKSCINAKVQIDEHAFRTSDDGLDVFLHIDEKRYRLIHFERVNELGLDEEELVVRKDGSKEEATVDIIMLHIP